MTDNNIGYEGVEDIAEAIGVNTGLVELYLDCTYCNMSRMLCLMF